MRCAAKAEHCSPDSLPLALNIAGRRRWVGRPAAQCNPSPNLLCANHLQVGVDGPMRRGPQRPDMVCWGLECTQLVWAVAGFGSLISPWTVPTDTGLVGRVGRVLVECRGLGRTGHCPGQRQPVATSSQPPAISIGWISIGCKICSCITLYGYRVVTRGINRGHGLVWI